MRFMCDIEYAVMPNAESCCGTTETVSNNFYELSKQIADMKTESIEATGVHTVVTD